MTERSVIRDKNMLRDAPIETVVRDAAGNFYERAFGDEPGSWVTMGDVALFDSSDLKFPVTVIWEPSGK